jgi:hypothetical protein
MAGARVDPTAVDELFVEQVDVSDGESIGWTIRGIGPLPWIGPLKMDLDPITRNGSVFGLPRIVLETQREPKTAVKLHRRRNISCRQNGMDAQKFRSHGLASMVATPPHSSQSCAVVN